MIIYCERHAEIEPIYKLGLSRIEAAAYVGVSPSLFDAMGKFVQESMKNGSLIDTAGLQPTAKGKRIRLAGGKLTVIDVHSPRPKK